MRQNILFNRARTALPDVLDACAIAMGRRAAYFDFVVEKEKAAGIGHWCACLSIR